VVATEPVLRGRTCWRSFSGTYAGAAVLALAIWVGGFALGVPVSGLLIVAAGLAVIVLTVAFTWLARASHQYRVFPDSLEVETGLLARSIDNLQLFRVRDLGVSQSILGRLLDFGNVTVASTDHSSPLVVLRGVECPRQVYDTLRELVARSQATRRTMIVESEPQ
jgi:membrane protein YdbS with pleckstrin-like domain